MLPANREMTKIQTICLILITLAILIGIGFYCWSIWEKYSYKPLPPLPNFEEFHNKK